MDIVVQRQRCRDVPIRRSGRHASVLSIGRPIGTQLLVSGVIALSVGARDMGERVEVGARVRLEQRRNSDAWTK